MKKSLLLIAGVLFSIIQLNAQCTITPSCTPDVTMGYCTMPDQSTPLPDGEVGTPYNTVIQFSLGTEASGIAIDSAEIAGVILPAGLSGSVNPVSGMIMPNGSACVDITGTPLNEVSGGTVTLQGIAYTALGNIAQDINFEITIVASSASIQIISSPNLFSLFPNPATTDLTVKVTKPIEIEICNLLGTKVHTELVKTSKTIDISTLRSGVYFVIDKATGTTQKLIKR